MGKPIQDDQGLTVMPSSLRHVEGTLILVPMPSVGSNLSMHGTNDRCFLHRLGVVLRGHPISVPGDYGVSSIKTLERSSCSS